MTKHPPAGSRWVYPSRTESPVISAAAGYKYSRLAPAK